MHPDPQTPPAPHSPWRLCTAPMMDWSDRHCRYFWRLMTRHARLYTEMVTTGALLYGEKSRFLQFHVDEHPLALQLGGSDPAALAECAAMAEDAGFDEVNLNCGCPSDRVQEGRIGACLMAEPELVAKCVQAMKSVVDIPITVKHRLGIDNRDSQAELYHFVENVADAGCDAFIVHARKAWLKGLSPKENREIPPLEYQRVYDLKSRYRHLHIVLNGGLDDIESCAHALEYTDGVMLGRAAYHTPFLLNEIDHRLFFEPANELGREDVIQAYITEYCEQQLQHDVKLHHLTRHILGIFAGQPGGRLFRRYLSEHATRPGADISVLHAALEQIHRYAGTNS